MSPSRTQKIAQRRRDLIAAAIIVISREGLQHMTMADVAGQAGTSVGLVSHYFGSKDGLLAAIMRHILTELKTAVARRRARAPATALAGLHAIIDGNFDRSQVNRDAARVWLAFWSGSLYQPELRRLQRINERRLYSNLCWYLRQQLPLPEARRHAAGLAALIDGLWLRGSLGEHAFDVARARDLAYAYVEHIWPKEDA